MRYLNLALLVAVSGSAAAFACGGDSGSVSAGQGGGGASGEGGAIPAGGKSPTGGTTGKGGTANGGTGGTTNAGTGGAITAGSGGTAAAGMAGVATIGEGGAAGAVGEGGAAGDVQTVGSLTVTLTGVPAGKTASVTVTGPGGFNQVLSATTTLQGLEPGTYSVAATPSTIRVAGAQVDSIFEPAVTGNGTVLAGATANATITYAPRPGTGMMWATNWTTRNAFGFSAAQLATTGNQTSSPAVALFLPNLGAGTAASSSLAFSSTGDAWVGYCRSTKTPQTIGKFAPAQLAASGTASADVVLTLPSTDGTYDCASALVFDAAGNLWVGMYRGHILRFNASDLTASGTPAPAVTLTSNTYLNGILDLAFDSAGNLFVAPYGGHIISQLSAAQLATSNAAVVPAVQLTLPTTAGPGGLAFAANGNLWISDYNTNSLIELNAADLGTTGTPTPGATLTGVAGPEQLAFDGAGNLWVAAYNTSTVVAFAAADLTSGGAKTPLTTLSGGGTLSSTFAIRFDPGSP